jgi:hypothetical protein
MATQVVVVYKHYLFYAYFFIQFHLLCASLAAVAALLCLVAAQRRCLLNRKIYN